MRKPTMVPRTRLFCGTALAVLLLFAGAARPSDAASLEQRLEEQRAAIERDRQSLNADCSSTSSLDTAKMEECRARHDDVVSRMAQYKKNLLLLKSQKTADREKCAGIAATVTRLEDGIKRGKIIMGKNEKFIREAEEGKKGAVDDAVKAVGKAAGEGASDFMEDRLSNFIKARDNLQEMKKGLDELEKAVQLRERARMLSEGQIADARAWVTDGIRYGDAVAELAKMSAEYHDAPRSGVKDPNPSPGEKLEHALKDFNDKFMNDAGGWEFAGKYLAEYGGGPLGKLAFKTAALGIKLEFAEANYLVSDADLAEFRSNQEKMKFELIKLQQKVKDLKASLVSNNCPAR